MKPALLAMIIVGLPAVGVLVVRVFRGTRTAVRLVITTKDLAGILARVILAPIEDPSDQDRLFRDQAMQVGVDADQFIFEAAALQCAAMGAAINRERVEGRIAKSVAENLVYELMHATHSRLAEMPSTVLSTFALDADTAIELIMERGKTYVDPFCGQYSLPDALAEVRKCFAEFCGCPGSDVLERIAWSLFQVRGDQHGDWLKTMNIVVTELRTQG